MNKRTLAIIAGVMLFAGLVVLQVASSMMPRATQVVTLPDGSTLRVEAVSYGKEHFRPGAWWHPLARRLPTGWQWKLSVGSGPEISTSEPSLGVWLSWEKPKTGPGKYGWEFALADELGVESRVGGQSTSPPPGRGHSYALCHVFPTFPRRGSTVALHLYQRDSRGNRQFVGSLKIPNPARGKYPEWRVASLPAPVKRGDLEITFQRLLVGVGYETKPAAPRPGEEGWARAEFDMKENGVPTDVWFPDGIELEDATGNNLRQSGWSSGVQAGQAHLRWQPYLWPSEAAWKIRVEFMRNHEKAVFSTNELIVVTGLALPAVDSVTELNLSTNRLGHTVRVQGLASGKGKFGTRHSRMSSAGVRLEVDVSPELGTSKRLTLQSVRDDQGRKVEGRGYGRSDGSYSFDYAPKPDAKSLDFTLAVQEVVTAEFLVKPELFKPASAAGK